MTNVMTPIGHKARPSSLAVPANIRASATAGDACPAQPGIPPTAREVATARPPRLVGQPTLGPALGRPPPVARSRAHERSASFVGRLKRITDARTIGEVWAVQLEMMAGYGFDRLLYASTRFRTEQSIGDLQDVLLLTNHARDYAGPMIERGLIRHAPMMSRAEPGARSWRETGRAAAESATRLARLAVESRARSGLAAGYDIVFPEVSTRARGALELCARPDLDQYEVDVLWDARGAEIELLCGLVHLKICHLPSWGGRRPLTRQQRRVLQWASEGKTAQDIGTIMELTPATVEKHLRLAREALDVQTTAQAVAKAAHWNQLFVDERPTCAR